MTTIRLKHPIRALFFAHLAFATHAATQDDTPHSNNVNTRQVTTPFLSLIDRSSTSPESCSATVNGNSASDTIQIPFLQNNGALAPLLKLNTAEQAWLNDNSRIKVVIKESFLPPAIFDEDETFRGPAADVLAKVSSLTGLEFDVQPVESAHEMLRRIKTGEANMIVAFNPSAERERSLRFTRSYLDTPFVLVSDYTPDSPKTLEELAGKRVALSRGSPLQELLTQKYADIRLIVVDNPDEALALVAGGKAEGAICSLVSARYLIARHYLHELNIQSTVGDRTVHTAFAVAPDARQLHSILEKALLAIPPQETQDLIYRWRSDVLQQNKDEMRQRQRFIEGLAATSVMLMFAGVWIFVLRRQIRRRETAEAALENQSRLMSVLINGTPHPIYVRDRQARLLICNAAYLKMLNTERQAVMGKTVCENLLSDPLQAQECHAAYLQVMRDGTAVVSDRNLHTPDGKDRTIYHWILPYCDSTGASSGIIGGWIDISDRQQLLEQLQDAKIEADNANRAKTVFLATISHEIRTPINVVTGMLELAMKRFDQGIQDRFALETASSAAQDLLELIGDILDIARIESGNLSLSLERANLRKLIETTANIFDGLAQQKKIRLSLSIDCAAECDVLIDPLRFKQILSNLLSNAVKFTPAGEIHLDVNVTPLPDTQHIRVEVKVKDSGIGISADDQQRLFNPFVQASNHQQSARSGTGLGLSISRTICDMMGGTLQLHSVPGEGTEIILSLSLQALEPLESAHTIEETTQAPSRSLNVLVIDDSSTNRILVSKQLSFLGHRVSTAINGAEGLKTWQAGCFDVVITDCSMPVMNGYDLTQAIRAEEQPGAKACLILGFTANVQAEEKVRCLEAGMNGCLFKPMSLKELEAGLSSAGKLPSRPAYAAADAMTAKLMDLSTLEKLTRGDVTVIRQLLDDLAANNDQDLLRLNPLVDSRDLQELSQVAHRIKGGVRVIQAYSVIAACERLEQLCLHESSKEDLALQVETLKQAMQQVARQMPEYQI